MKLLVLAFTLLPAARFAVWTGRLAAGWPASMVSTCSVAALFAAVTYFWGTHWWGRYPAWMILGLPFAPLAGVLAARPAPPTISTAAWLTGWLAAWVPLSIREVAERFGSDRPAVIEGWLIAFVIAYVGAVIVNRHGAGPPQLRSQLPQSRLTRSRLFGRACYQ